MHHYLCGWWVRWLGTRGCPIRGETRYQGVFGNVQILWHCGLWTNHFLPLCPVCMYIYVPGTGSPLLSYPLIPPGHKSLHHSYLVPPYPVAGILFHLTGYWCSVHPMHHQVITYVVAGLWWTHNSKHQRVIHKNNAFSFKCQIYAETTGLVSRHAYAMDIWVSKKYEERL